MSTRTQRSLAASPRPASQPWRSSIRYPARDSMDPTTARPVNSPGEQVFGVLIGDLAAPGAAIKDRVRGITEGVHESLPALQLAALDTGGQSARADALLTKFLLTQPGQRLLIAT